jgi:hypothetical protein
MTTYWVDLAAEMDVLTAMLAFLDSVRDTALDKPAEQLKKTIQKKMEKIGTDEEAEDRKKVFPQPPPPPILPMNLHASGGVLSFEAINPEEVILSCLSFSLFVLITRRHFCVSVSVAFQCAVVLLSSG